MLLYGKANGRTFIYFWELCFFIFDVLNSWENDPFTKKRIECDPNNSVKKIFPPFQGFRPKRHKSSKPFKNEYRIFLIKRWTPNKRRVYRADFKINAPGVYSGSRCLFEVPAFIRDRYIKSGFCVVTVY